MFGRFIPRARILVVSASVLLLAVGTMPLAAQMRPGYGGGKRPPIFDVTGEKVQKLDPVAKLIKERKKLNLTDAQAATLDSVETALRQDIAPFVARIDSLVPKIQPSSRRQESAVRDSLENDPVMNPLSRLWSAIAQVKLRYEAAMLTAMEALTDEQRNRAATVVEDEYAGMEALTRGMRSRW